MASGKNLRPGGPVHVGRIIPQSGTRGTRPANSPRSTDEIRARAVELHAEKPGDYTRVSVRLFRECGVRYSPVTVKSWLVAAGVELPDQGPGGRRP